VVVVGEAQRGVPVVEAGIAKAGTLGKKPGNDRDDAI